jgi:hypothetical protein
VIQGKAPVNVVKKILIPKQMGSFLINLATISFSRRTLLLGMS